ncbi:MAG: Bug family tripartite tricarboxylate transporter substrate binding protein [Usitatibacter sp.]
MKLHTFAGALVAAALSTASPAQEWPSGPVHIVVPFGPGSTPDIVARLVADRLSARLGKPVIVDNKPGAGGNIGTDAVAKAAPDGQTIGLSIAGPLAVNTLLYRSMPYDPARDLAPVTIAATQPSILVVAPRLGVSTTAELVALLKANPGKYNYSSMGGGSISHLAMEALSARSGAQIVHVPYSGSAPAVLALLTGEVDLACLPATVAMPQIKAGKLKALAVATEKRSPALPGIPTLREAGIENVFADAWMGFVVPARTPAPVVKRLQEELVRALDDPQVREKLRAQYMDVVAGSPAEFRAVMAADLARWKPVIEKNHIKLD